MIRLLKSIGYSVAIINSDQSSVNRKAFSVLGVTVEQPYFFVDDIKVVALFDVPHLFKSARTTFLEKQMTTSDGVVSGVPVKKIFESQDGRKIFPKLSYRHLNYDTFDKMRVFLTVQILSKSVANGVQSMIESGFFETEDEQTEAQNASSFLYKMNDLFDLLNGKSSDDPNPLKRGISSKNIELLREFFDFTMSITYHGKKVYWINGLQQTVNGIILFFEERHKTNENFSLMTRRLNQDALENMFGLIRANGGNNRNPTLLDFLRIVSKLLTTSLNVSFENSNCEIDECSNINVISLDTVKSNLTDDVVIDDDLDDEVYILNLSSIRFLCSL